MNSLWNSLSWLNRLGCLNWRHCQACGRQLEAVIHHFCSATPCTSSSWLEVCNGDIEGCMLCMQNCWQLCYLTTGHTSVLAAFLIFLKVNGGIVLGDKSAHPAKLHLMQIWYFALFTTGTMLFASDALSRCAWHSCFFAGSWQLVPRLCLCDYFRLSKQISRPLPGGAHNGLHNCSIWDRDRHTAWSLDVEVSHNHWELTSHNSQ